MSAAVAAVRPSVGVPQAFLRTCRAEWSRLWSVRSTWWFVLATAVAGLGIGLILGLDAADSPGMDVPTEGAWTGGRFAGMFILFGLLATAVVSTTGDHTTAGIVPSLQWTPRRGILLSARTVVVTATTTLYGLLLVALAGILVWWLVPRFGLPGDGAGAVLGDLAYAFATGALMSVGLGLLTRSTAGGLVSVIALVIVIPILFGNLPFEAAQRIAEYVPGTSVISLVVGEGPEGMAPDRARLTLALWAAGSMLLGGLRLLRSDADR
jgi:ABC-2 type transport system permease protein